MTHLRISLKTISVNLGPELVMRLSGNYLHHKSTHGDFVEVTRKRIKGSFFSGSHCSAT